MVIRASTIAALAAALIGTTACAAPKDRQAAARAPFSAPLMQESAGRSSRSCSYWARREQMNLVIDKVLSCPSAVVCQFTQQSIKPVCQAPIRPNTVS